MIENIAEKKLEIIIGLFLLGGIIAWLIIPTSFQDTTIILEGGGGGAPVSCLPSGGLVLAQNLTDLCDVTIISPTTNQLIQYNGSQWVNVNSGFITTNATCSNLGSGAFVCANSINNVLAFKSLVALDGIQITNSSTEIFIENTAPESTDCSNVGTGNFILKTSSIDCVANSLIAGTGITIANTTDDYTFSSQCANTGTGEAVCESSNNINSLIAGNSISITDTIGDLTITNTGAIKLCEVTAVGGETSLACNLSTAPQTIAIGIYHNSSVTNTVWEIRFNADSGNNYAIRSSTNGGADGTLANTDSISAVTITENQGYYYTWNCNNPSSDKEKYCYGFRTTSANGAGNAPARVEFASKWANLTSNITSVDLVRTASTGTLTAGSYIVVFGVS